MVRVCGPGLAVLAFALGSPGVAAQPGPSGAPGPTVPGTAVLHVGPVGADTLPLLCEDEERPEFGFITEMSDPEWAPRFDLSLDPTGAAADEVTIGLDLGSGALGATFPVTPSNEGFLTVVAWVTRADGSGGRNVSFTARCGERLVRPGGSKPTDASRHLIG